MASDIDDNVHARLWGRRPLFGRLNIALLALLVTAPVAAACGGGSATPGVASIGSTTLTTSAAGTASSNGQPDLQHAYQEQLAYSQCMRSHGVPSYPDPTLSAHSLTIAGGHLDQRSPQFVSAGTTCKRLVPDGGPPSPAQIQAAITSLLKDAQCMRTHGVPNFPDPVVNGHEIGISLKGVNPNAPGFQAAQRICQKLAPLSGPG